MKEKAYYEKVNVKNETLLRNLLQKMPPYCKQFFIGIEPTTSSRTRIAYAYDLNCFFDYLHENNPLCSKKDITEIPLSVLGNLAPMDIEEYLSYLIKKRIISVPILKKMVWNIQMMSAD